MCMMTALQLGSGERKRGPEVTRVCERQGSMEPTSDLLLQRNREPQLWACKLCSPGERRGEERGVAVERQTESREVTAVRVQVDQQGLLTFPKCPALTWINLQHRTLHMESRVPLPGGRLLKAESRSWSPGGKTENSLHVLPSPCAC